MSEKVDAASAPVPMTGRPSMIPKCPLGARRQKTDLHIAEPTVTRSVSPAPSLRSQRAKQYRASLPVRTARLLQRSRAQTPASEVAPADAASPPPAAALLQDVVDIKTLLLQLKRVLHEPGEELHTMSETLDPLLGAIADLPARANGRRLPPHTTSQAPPAPGDHTLELRRQILFLQSQLEERDRLVRTLQQEMSKLTDPAAPSAQEDTCNVATQTDRLRPPAINATSVDNPGLVSWCEQNGRRQPTYNEAQRSRKPPSNGLPICQCGRRSNGRPEPEAFDKRNEQVHLKTNGRVGSRYIQSVSNHKRDLSAGERSLRRTLYASRSIENFHNQGLSLRRTDLSFEPLMKHCTSIGDIYASSNGQSPLQTSQSTDTDYSSDGGYKSLPSSAGCNGVKASNIPRRSVERRLFASKPSVRASAI